MNVQVLNLRYAYNCDVRVVRYEEYSFCVGASSGGSPIGSMKLDGFVCS